MVLMKATPRLGRDVKSRRGGVLQKNKGASMSYSWLKRRIVCVKSDQQVRDSEGKAWDGGFRQRLPARANGTLAAGCISVEQSVVLSEPFKLQIGSGEL